MSRHVESLSSLPPASIGRTAAAGDGPRPARLNGHTGP
ncbi:hypothetical protein I550_3457 [Mycobacterium intracellulare 1956]|uniref:Uncharacterized protein n=1 Tax=Mycobacterium intracellulare 1956 TaxID=1299331 RepID=X8CHM3_MYCIT|nr:hypothetical protein OCQ_34170 [Mycobacterium paraintracellulare]ASW86329.1 4-aminobutyrate aminotransferase [Mycobacterium intracellulare]EUA32069.1 hypothetical protein I548_0843 [Mycobacterium intracellulare]EUA55306.1 hypothetical protein I550_3457 [Mycobacterium intracellulare 1956]OSC19491.1 4-aminobutyrate aminotransferase [Mycobacterium paraintracellulare]